MRLKFIFYLLIIAIFLPACNVRADTSKSYFDGSVLVEYKQFNRRISDYLKFTFHEKGTFQVTFSYTPDRRERGNLPEAFTLIIEDRTRQHIVEEYVLADFLTITIEGPSGLETHDFQ